MQVDGGMEPGRLYEWASFFCKKVAENCRVTEDLANLMAGYRSIAQYGDKMGNRRIVKDAWQAYLLPRFYEITGYLMYKAAGKTEFRRGRRADE